MVVLLIRKKYRVDPNNMFFFINPKDDAILFEDEVAKGGVFFRALTPIRAQLQRGCCILKPSTEFNGSQGRVLCNFRDNFLEFLFCTAGPLNFE